MNEQLLNDLSNMSFKNVKVINFYQEIQNHSEYLMVDGVHLTDEGNEVLSRILNEVIN